MSRHEYTTAMEAAALACDYAFDPWESMYTGRLVGIIDIVTFQSHTLGRIDLEFRLSVDAYLDFKSRG